MPWPFEETLECERLFQEKFRQPPPWFEAVTPDDLEQLAWKLSTQLSMSPPSIHLPKALSAAWERMPPARAHVPDIFRGSTEPLRSALPRLGVPVGDTVVIYREPEPHAVKLRCKDVLAFESLLWQDDSWLVQEDAAWILFGPHEHLALWLDFRKHALHPSMLR